MLSRAQFSASIFMSFQTSSTSRATSRWPGLVHRCFVKLREQLLVTFVRSTSLEDNEWGFIISGMIPTSMYIPYNNIPINVAKHEHKFSNLLHVAI